MSACRRRQLLMIALLLYPVFAANGAIASPITLTSSVSTGPSGSYEREVFAGPLVDTSILLSVSGRVIDNPLVTNLSTFFTALAGAYVDVSAGTVRLGVQLSTTGRIDLAAPTSPDETFLSGAAGNGVPVASVEVADALTIVGGPAEGFIAAQLLFSTSLDTMTSAPPTSSPQSLAWGWAEAFGTTFDASSETGNSLPATATIRVPYQANAANLDLVLVGWAAGGMFCVMPDVTTSASCSVAARTAMQVLLQSIQVFDGEGRRVADAYAVGASGVTYANNDAVAPIPEPSTLFSVATVTAVLLVARVRRRRRI